MVQIYDPNPNNRIYENSPNNKQIFKSYQMDTNFIINFSILFIEILVLFKRVILTSVFRVLVNNSVKESFFGEKKTINILTTFFIFHKNNVKIFLK